MGIDVIINYYISLNYSFNYHIYLSRSQQLDNEKIKELVKELYLLNIKLYLKIHLQHN